MPTTRAAKNDDDDRGPTYFELITEIDEEDLPKPIQVKASAGAKSFIVQPMNAKRLFDMRAAIKANDTNAYEHAVLGDAFDPAMAMYGMKPREFWMKFVRQVEDHFYGRGASTAAAPGK